MSEYICFCEKDLKYTVSGKSVGIKLNSNGDEDNEIIERLINMIFN